MTILLIGPGYTGAPLAAALAEDGHVVVTASRSGAWVAGCTTLALDVTDRAAADACAASLSPAPDLVVHCASASRGGGEDAYRRVYLDGMRHLLEAFPGVPLFFTSSTGVYGQTDGSTVTEDSPTLPTRPTAEILCEAEKAVLAAGGCVLRLSGIYGPGRSIHLQRLFAGEASIESGEPSRFLNQIHRDDIVSAVRHLVASGPETWRGEIFHVTDSRPLTMRECYEWLSEHFGIPLAPESPPTAGKRGWTNKAISNAKLCATGWEPRYPTFSDAVREDEELVASMR